MAKDGLSTSYNAQEKFQSFKKNYVFMNIRYNIIFRELTKNEVANVRGYLSIHIIHERKRVQAQSYMTTLISLSDSKLICFT